MMVTPEEVADAILAKLKTDRHTFWIDPETHSEQHEFIKTLIDERAEKLARAKAIQDKIAGSLILSGILLIVGFIGSGVMDYIRAHLK
jgi:hypothetical protein